MTQVRLAELAKTTQPTIEKLENGKMQLTERWLRRLARPLGVAPGDLIEGGQDPTITPHERELLRLFRQAQGKNQHSLLEVARMAAGEPVESTSVGSAGQPAPSPEETAVRVRLIRGRTLHEPPVPLKR